MHINDKELLKMIVFHLILGVIAIVLKLTHPEYSTVTGFINSFKAPGISMVVVLILPLFILFSFTIFVIGLYIVGQETIGRLIFNLKDIFRLENNYEYVFGEAQYHMVILISIYIFLIIPIFLKIVWPLMVPFLFIILYVLSA